MASSSRAAAACLCELCLSSAQDERLSARTSLQWVLIRYASHSYNRGNKKFQISSALLFNFWSAAANACLGNDSKFDSAVCTMEDPKFGKVVVVMSAMDTNSKIIDRLAPVPK